MLCCLADQQSPGVDVSCSREPAWTQKRSVVVKHQTAAAEVWWQTVSREWQRSRWEMRSTWMNTWAASLVRKCLPPGGELLLPCLHHLHLCQRDTMFINVLLHPRSDTRAPVRSGADVGDQVWVSVQFSPEVVRKNIFLQTEMKRS